MRADPVSVSTRFYDAIAAEFRQSGGELGDAIQQSAAQWQAMLSCYSRDIRILDCACGSGGDTLGIAMAGYEVVGSDASRAMLAEARKKRKELGLSARFYHVAWRELPHKIRMRFDLVICGNNSFPHAVTDEEMLASLKGMFSVLREGGVCRIAWSHPDVYGKPGETRVVPPALTVQRKKGRKELHFEVWEVNEDVVTQSLFRIAKCRRGWVTRVASAPLRRLWPETMEMLMGSAGFSHIQITESIHPMTKQLSGYRALGEKV